MHVVSVFMLQSFNVGSLRATSSLSQIWELHCATAQLMYNLKDTNSPIAELKTSDKHQTSRSTKLSIQTKETISLTTHESSINELSTRLTYLP